MNNMLEKTSVTQFDADRRFWRINNGGAWIAAFWIFAFLFPLGNNYYEKGRDLNRVCELLGEHDVWDAHPTTPQQEIDTI